MGFYIKIKKGRQYRININKTGKCKYYPDLSCACCNQNCDHNVSIDDEAEEEIWNLWDKMVD